MAQARTDDEITSVIMLSKRLSSCSCPWAMMMMRWWMNGAAYSQGLRRFLYLPRIIGGNLNGPMHDGSALPTMLGMAGMNARFHLTKGGQRDVRPSQPLWMLPPGDAPRAPLRKRLRSRWRLFWLAQPQASSAAKSAMQ